jgi:hypothetical protein
MQSESDWGTTPGISDEMSVDMKVRAGIRSKVVFARKLAAGLLVGASLMWGGLAWAGIPTTVPGNAASTNANSAVVASKLYGALNDKVATGAPDTKVRVIVHLKAQADLSRWPSDDSAGAIMQLKGVAASTQPQSINAIQAEGNVSVYERYWVFNGFAVEAPISVVQKMATRDDIDYIIEDGSFTAPADPVAQEAPDNASANWNIYQVRAPETWALGYDGTGRTLANLDSGVDGTHEALAARWRGIQPGHSAADSWFDPFGISPDFPTATGAHGTHTMGTTVGYQGDPTGMNEIGQSKGATWIACRIYDDSGKGPFSQMHACFQFMVDPDGDPNTHDQPDAVGNSWGDTASDSFPDLEWWPDVLAWRAAGIVPVFSNANSGPGAGTVNEPGSYPISIGVGAVSSTRVIAGFSSRGPAENLPPWNVQDNWERSDWNLIKPEVVAPGVNVRSSIPGNAYANYNGTSMASPHVTGLVGLLRQIRPDLSVNEFYNIIIDTAYYTSTWGTRPNNNYGWGEIDDYAAAVYVRDAGTVTGEISDGSCDTAVPGAAVWVYDNTPGSRAQGVGIRKLFSDDAGNYHTILAAGTYTVTVSAPGYYGASYSTTIISSTLTSLPIVLAKMPTGAVSGVVTDGTDPVAGALVSVAGLSGISTVTGADGSYSLPYVPDGTFTLMAEKCGYSPANQSITVTYPDPLMQDLTLGASNVLLADDFESGNLDNWTVTGGSITTAIWNPSDIRAVSGTYAARAGIPDEPMYTGAANTYMASDVFDTSAADQVWLSYNLYDSAESEYDIFRAQVSSDGGTTWATVQGQASPVHGWQEICLDISNWKSATMMIRFYFHSDASNWNDEVFEGPSVDDVRLSYTDPQGTPLPAYTPTPGAPLPCGNCTISFTDVISGSTFYPFIQCMACQGIINGYPCGGPGEPCDPNNNPYFRPGNNVTRGQFAKIAANAAGFDETPGAQQYEDVLPGSTFYDFVWRLSDRGFISGYPCGGPGEPCGSDNLPYFRPNANVTRGQIAKIDSNAAGYNETAGAQQYEDVLPGSTFYDFIWRLSDRGLINGYPCGGTGEPCGPNNLPYFRPSANATRGQASKIVSNTFFPSCNVGLR